ncbi:MAG: hypothetical protein ACK5CY_01445 [Bacteroidia bacterium]|jgi:copper chaperone
MQLFETNINCDSCINAVRVTLNELVGENGWTVDTNTPSKLLTINSDVIKADIVIHKLEEDGFIAKPIMK